MYKNKLKIHFQLKSKKNKISKILFPPFSINTNFKTNKLLFFSIKYIKKTKIKKKINIQLKKKKKKFFHFFFLLPKHLINSFQNTSINTHKK